MSAATTGTVSAMRVAPTPNHHPDANHPYEHFRADLATVMLRPVAQLAPASSARAIPLPRNCAYRQLPILSVTGLLSRGLPSPATDFLFFREPLQRSQALIGQWGAAAKAGSQSEAWSQFVGEIGERFFPGSRRQRIMDALVLSLDILPPHDRADALACLLGDGIEGQAALEEFWKYVGMHRIPEPDRPRVAQLIRQYGIGQ
ncbi:hypothetical protein [Pandoraea faecigallinarum]|uniref:Uncharacterized protein n=1 Tax=Pandoraea faecigallinarum TaxID=656179 RepID=A0A0H3WXF9_9BURK|nr:hypothetical protein [Pandoraea faecigallinarum]